MSETPARHTFDRTFWDEHYQSTGSAGAGSGAVSTSGTTTGRELPAHPYLSAELGQLSTGTALDAGCGTGAEVIWLAQHGWDVTGADISTTALQVAAQRAEAAGVANQVTWVSTDLTDWEPRRTWDLVVTSYAHSQTGQLAFYEHIAHWVSPGGTLLIVGHGHGHTHADGQHGQHGRDAPPEHATATLAGITSLFAAPTWRVRASHDVTRTVVARGLEQTLHDVVVRLHRAAYSPSGSSGRGERDRRGGL